MFQLTLEEEHAIRSQIATLSPTSRNHWKKHLPLAFTENGIAMLSGILSSPTAIKVNISIMRIFTRLRSFLMFERELGNRVTTLEKDSSMMFKIVFERLDSLEIKKSVTDPTRKKIGLNCK